MLDARLLLEDAKVLDLYAGTGALALEAISRGAALAHMVERDGKAAAVCVANARSVQKVMVEELAEVETKVINKAVGSFLSTPTSDGYTLVFIDPPYEVPNEEISSNLTALLPILAADAVVVIERSSRTPKFDVPAGYESGEEKHYGDTAVFWLNHH
jgi:16S rRNA (guanine966-N2)-methyltransferase